MEEVKGIDFINSVLRESLDFYQNIDFDYFDIIDKLANYIINNKKELKIEKNKSKIDKKKSIRISKEFLDNIDKKYVLSLESALDNKRIYLNKIKKTNDTEFAFCDSNEDNIKYMYIPYFNNSEDVYSLSHELIHYSDQTVEEITAFENSFCEVYSILSEFLLQDYLKDNYNIKYINLNKKKLFKAIYQNALLVSFDINMIKAYLENGSLTKAKLLDIIGLYTEEQQNILEYSIEYMQENNILCFDLDHRYILGVFFASYIHDKILENPKLLKEYYSISSQLDYYDAKDFIEFLDLNYKDSLNFDLEDESYEKLYKSYQKELKRI